MKRQNEKKTKDSLFNTEMTVYPLAHDIYIHESFTLKIWT